jgi:hypothetical protein
MDANKSPLINLNSGTVERLLTAPGEGLASGGRCLLKALVPTVRNIFKILECHKRDDTTQKSTSKAKFTFAEGCTLGSLGGMHTGRKSTRVLSDTKLSLSFPWIGQVWGSQSTQLAN